ncbi:hypothetical protein [Candidatus Minimicrobia naudis]
MNNMGQLGFGIPGSP